MLTFHKKLIDSYEKTLTKYLSWQIFRSLTKSIFQFQIQGNQQIPRLLKVILTLQSYGQKKCFNDNILRLTNQLQLISHLIVMKS